MGTPSPSRQTPWSYPQHESCLTILEYTTQTIANDYREWWLAVPTQEVERGVGTRNPNLGGNCKLARQSDRPQRKCRPLVGALGAGICARVGSDSFPDSRVRTASHESLRWVRGKRDSVRGRKL